MNQVAGIQRLAEKPRSTTQIAPTGLLVAAMVCLAYGARPATREVDGVFRPSKQVPATASIVALANRLPKSWPNDAVKRFFSEHSSVTTYLALRHLMVFMAEASFLLAMKCLSARIGAEFHDVDDIRYPLRYLNIATVDEAKTVLASYYALARFPQKMLELLTCCRAGSARPSTPRHAYYGHVRSRLVLDVTRAEPARSS